MPKTRLRRLAAYCLFCLLSIVPITASANMTLPQSPEGYSWRQIDELKAAVLLPDGWSFSSRISGVRHQYILAAPTGNEADNTDLKTVLTMMVIPQREETEDLGLVPASRFIAALFDEISKNRAMERTQSAPQGPFETIRYQYVYGAGDEATQREYSLLVANDATGTFYIFTFQAPLNSWDEAWQKITVVLDHIFLDDEI